MRMEDCLWVCYAIFSIFDFRKKKMVTLPLSPPIGVPKRALFWVLPTFSNLSQVNLLWDFCTYFSQNNFSFLSTPYISNVG